ncbi:hypothetical protein P4C99_21840 [Pontiellaceae bacterium B1224]|nr:hypothetical protein [Pontiellaceae bacterium B1224]
MKKIGSIIITLFPLLAFAQEDELFEQSILEKTGGIIRDLIAWPALCLLIISIVSWLILIPIKKRIKRFKLLHASLVLIIFSVWYFYPSFSYKGNYSTEWKWDDESLTISIDEEYCFEDEVLGEYSVNPFTRLLWVKTDRAPALVFGDLPVKLRWNKIYQPVFKHGWVEFKKENSANQRVDLTVKTPVESGNEQGTAGHP